MKLPLSLAKHCSPGRILFARLDAFYRSPQCLAVAVRKKDKRYFEVWLRRTGKQLAVSGRMTQVAVVLASENGSSVDKWRARLRELLDGGEAPSLELLTRIDALLSTPCPRLSSAHAQGSLF